MLSLFPTPVLFCLLLCAVVSPLLCGLEQSRSVLEAKVLYFRGKILVSSQDKAKGFMALPSSRACLELPKSGAGLKISPEPLFYII